jgi:hypothetical protein
MQIYNYEKLRLDVLEGLVASRGIDCKNNKTDMIRHLKMDDDGEYIKETTHEKFGDQFIIGIDYRNSKHLYEIGRLIEKKEARSLNRYSMNLCYYKSKQKLL